ncbi:MAG TPA: hypothetical protein VFE47_14410 [Tepidisphaeraceae bacterium]|nr:hypothetical protein [Tepidisphaeraceae bacterium]
MLLCSVSVLADEPQPESVWLEAETFGPLHGSNFSFQHPDKTTKGSWAIAGPDVAQAWTQGGESGWMSVAARADEADELVIGRSAEIPVAGRYTLWVRYSDHRGKKQSFGVRIKQNQTTFTHVFGEKPVIDDLDPMKLMWDCAFGWDHATVDLKKGQARIELYTTGITEARRQVDCLCLTTDASYHPAGREKPDAPAWKLLREMRAAEPGSVNPLATKAAVDTKDRWNLPAAWKGPTQAPTFLWNSGQPWLDELKKPGDRVEWPFNIDESLQKLFIADFHGKDIPVFGDAMSGPVLHIPLYPQAFAPGSAFLAWLGKHPDRRFCILLNYAEPSWPKQKVDRAAVHENLVKTGDRFVGYIAGENISYDNVDQKALDEKIRAAKTRGDVLAALRDAHTAATIKKFSDYAGAPLSAEQAWEKVIPCLSAGNEAFTHALAEWGVKRIGHESCGNEPCLARSLAFIRGAARQFHAGIVDYQSCNLGDASTIFSRESQMYPASARYIFDNQYDAWAGAGINWVLKDYLLFHEAGADAFYHEEGQDIFWKPGGNSAGDDFPISLSPRGRVTQAFMNLVRSHPRASQYTPIAFLLDPAHGYSQQAFQVGAFGLDPTLNPAVLTPGRHEESIQGWLDVAYFPAPEMQNEPATAIRQTYVNGIFGDIFDVLVAAPHHADILPAYPVVIVAGNLSLTKEWGDALSEYMNAGGTLVICESELTGDGAKALALPTMGEATEASAFQWEADKRQVQSNTFAFRPIQAGAGAVALATVSAKPVAISMDHGRGRLIFVSIPLGLGLDEKPVPLLALLMQRLTAGLVPIQVRGDVETTIGRFDDGAWLVTLLNNRGVIKPQHGILATDYHEAQLVRLSTPYKVAHSREWVTDQDIKWSRQENVSKTEVTVPAGVVRLVRIEPSR